MALAGELNVADLDQTASRLFNVDVKVDDLSREAADRFIADLTARVESTEGAPF